MNFYLQQTISILSYFYRSMANQRVSFYTLGCKLNYSETSALSTLMEKDGYKAVPFGEASEFVVINTCSVTDHADRKCKKVVREALKHAPGARVVVVGCYAQLKPQEIVEIEGVNLVLGAAEKFNLTAHLNGLGKTDKVVRAGDIQSVATFQPSALHNDRTRAFLKVQDGCSYSCSFCTIPLARGISRSATIDDLLRQAEQLAVQGYREIVLTGVNTGDFGFTAADGQVSPVRNESFFQLIQALDALKLGLRYRISSIEPNLLTDDIIHFVADTASFVPHFHIPLQSGSNDVLRGMRRRYKREVYESRVLLSRQLMPDACIGSDVIVGFPGETDAHHAETRAFIEALPVSYLHVFPYSERANTPAATLPGKVQDRVKSERAKDLIRLSDEKRAAFYATQLGTTRQALFEEKNENGLMEGYTENYVRVSAKYDPLLIGDVKDVLIGPMENGVCQALEPATVPAG